MARAPRSEVCPRTAGCAFERRRSAAFGFELLALFLALRFAITAPARPSIAWTHTNHQLEAAGTAVWTTDCRGTRQRIAPRFGSRRTKSARTDHPQPARPTMRRISAGAIPAARSSRKPVASVDFESLRP